MAILAGLVLLGGTALFGGCSVSPRVSVVHIPSGGTQEPVVGDPVKIKRRAQEGYVGLRGGYYVVRGHEDWRQVWSGGSEPPFPSELDPSTSMLVLIATSSPDSVDLKIDRVVETGSLVAVTAHETRAGEGCVARPDRPPFDAVVVPRIDKPVKFFIAANRSESCGEPPLVSVHCRVNDTQGWNESVSAQPGDHVDCTTNAEPRGKFAITDRALTLGGLPPGSTSKLAYSSAPVRGMFPIDAFGTYTVRAEATDDSGRKAFATATVTALPPKSKDVMVQLAWTNFDAIDEADTFPRVKLRAIEKSRTKMRKECSSDAAHKELCDVKAHGAYTHMLLKTSDKPIDLELTYVDERFDEGPLVCIQLYFDGARTAEICDRKHRAPDERWEIGTVDMKTGNWFGASDADAGVDAGKP